jgi:hypothetical protein
VTNFRSEAGEFARRWWKVGLPVFALAVVIVVALVAGGDDANQAATTTSAALPSGNSTQAHKAKKPSATRKKDHHKQKKDGGSKQGSSKPATQASGPGSGPATEYGHPPGHPVGQVPPGASQSDDEQAVARTLTTFLKAVSRADGPQACAQLSPEGRKRVEREVHQVAPETEGSPCEGAIVLYQGAYGPEARNPQITGVAVSGDQATAHGPPDSQRADMSKYGNVWLIDNYGWN